MNDMPLESDLIKHNAIIQSDNREITFLDKKISNVLLINAFPDLEKKEIHTIRFSVLSSEIGWESDPSKTAITDSIQRLANTEIRWNILGDDITNDWTSSKILASYRVVLNEGKIEYSYSPHLRAVLRHPNIYSRINLDIQNTMSSKYSLNLWELLKTQIGDKLKFNKKIETREFEIEEFKNIIGIKGTVYSEFKYVKNRIIIPSVQEINEKSDIYISETKYKKDKRTIVAISFLIQYKESIQSSLPLSSEERINEFIKDSKYKNVYISIKSWCVSDTWILDKFDNYSLNQINDIINSATIWINKKNRKKSPAILTSAFKDEWQTIEDPSKVEIKEKKSRKKPNEKVITNNEEDFDKTIAEYNALPEDIKVSIELECQNMKAYSFIGDNAKESTLAYYYQENKNKFIKQ